MSSPAGSRGSASSPPTSPEVERGEPTMKPPTTFLGEMTNPEVEAFVRDHDIVLVPVRSTEQHGPHGPLLTDVFVPVEVARRVSSRAPAAVAPSINYGLS